MNFSLSNDNLSAGHVKEYFRDKAKGFILVTDIDNLTAKSFYENNGWKTGEYDFYTFFY